MKVHYKLFLSLVVGAFIAFTSCQEDEKLDLVTFPENQPSITIDNAEGASKAMLTAVYKSDGTLALDGPVTRTYTFRFAASPEDATVTFDVLSTNIPRENIGISATEIVLPAGATDASVTVTLKNEDFSFAEPNYDAATYELGVKANVKGSKIGVEPIESKVVIEKEAYVAACSIVGVAGNTAYFERAYSNGVILDSSPISYTFKLQLDKPARKNVKVKLAASGLGEQFLNNITVTPAEIVILAGERSSANITWTITDDFLLTTTKPETHTLILTASTESDDPVVTVNKKENFLTLNIDKILRNFEYVSNKVANWIELDKLSWSVNMTPGVTGVGSSIINGIGGPSGANIYKSGNFWFIVDMKSQKTMTGLGIDYNKNISTAASPRNIAISTSLDNETWTSQGLIGTPQSFIHYFQFSFPTNARYVKVELTNGYTFKIAVNEVYMYNIE